MISVASIMRGEPADFKSVCPTTPASSPAPYESESLYHPGGYARKSFFANYEVFSTFTPDEYNRPAMRLPFYAGDKD